MSFVSFSRRSFSGTAPDTALAAGIDNATLTVTVVSATGWPDGTGGNFTVIFEPGTANEEKALGASRSGNTITLAQRALEGSAVAHVASSVVRHGLAAVDVDEANYAVSQTVGKVTAKGDILYGSAANTFTKLAKGTTGQAPTWQSDGSLAAANPVAAAHSHVESDVTSLVGDLSALTSGKMAKPATAWATGSIIAGTGAGTFDLVPAGGAGTIPIVQADGTIAFGAGNGAPQVQAFTTSGTWTKPSGITTVDVVVVGGGAGGDGAASGQAGTGGGGGAMSRRRFAATDLPSTVTVTIGAGGAGRAGGTNGSGGNGGTTSFGALLTAGGGTANTGGVGEFAGGNGGAGGNSGGVGGSGSGGATGGGGSANFVGNPGGAGGSYPNGGSVGGPAGTSTTNAAAGTTFDTFLPGGGGGAGSGTVAHNSGANGVRGGGGGAGGNGGGGGNGGDGYVVVMCW